ncbi:hypothetical protein GCM10023187_38510 [Nibrella viscosa]|uniref:Uncharacterized protein n=1 Tax=Nibrella viscosa TaxID=1084524 RepID=A0ABP8KPU9_9BACT
MREAPEKASHTRSFEAALRRAGLLKKIQKIISAKDLTRDQESTTFAVPIQINDTTRDILETVSQVSPTGETIVL